MTRILGKTAPNRDAQRLAVPDRASILVADDDDAMRELVCARLTADGYEVHPAASGVELMAALERLSTQAWPADGVDLMILDLRMPGLTGLDAIRKLRAAHWDVPTILMTAFPNTLVRIEAENLNVDVLAKPFPLDTLVKTTRRVLAGTRDERTPPHAFRAPLCGPFGFTGVPLHFPSAR